ncbi:MAG: diheme cytochrome c [Burkholderiaceae bacterium]|jgi:Dihaem cytochrome c.
MRPSISLSAALALSLAAAGLARADSPHLQPAARLPAYQQECAACHMAYPPGLLPARSWQRIMSGLDKHYGSDASLDAASVQQISTWLQANAGTSRRGREEPPQDRITRSAWFEREHREVPAEVWRRPAVGSRAQCAACHSRAETGDFDEDRIHIPR